MTITQAIHPLDREGCWLCAGGGEIETYRASDDRQVTVGCPVCVQNDLGFMRQAAETARDDLAGELMLVRADRDALAAWLEECLSAMRHASEFLDESDKDAALALHRMNSLSSRSRGSDASLTARDARMKSEAVEELAAQPGMEHFTASRAAEVLGAAYRKQAEGEA